MRRWLVRGGAVVLLLGCWLSWQYLVPRYVERRVRAALRAHGFPNATVHVRRITFRGVELDRIRLSPEVHAARAMLELSLSSLWHRRVDRLRIAGVEIELSRAKLAELASRKSMPAGNEKSNALPVGELVFERARIRVRDHGQVVWDVKASGSAVLAQLWARFAAEATGMIGGTPARVRARGKLARDGDQTMLELDANVPMLALAQLGHRAQLSEARLTANATWRGTTLVRVASTARADLQFDGAELGPVSVEVGGDRARLSATLSCRNENDEPLRASIVTEGGLSQWRAPLAASWTLAGVAPAWLRKQVAAAGITVEHATLTGQGHVQWRGWSARRVTAESARLGLRAARAVVGNTVLSNLDVTAHTRLVAPRLVSFSIDGRARSIQVGRGLGASSGVLVHGGGKARMTGAKRLRVSVDEASWTINADRLRLPASKLALRRPVLRLRHTAQLSRHGVRVDIEPGSALRASRMWIGRDRSLALSRFEATVEPATTAPLVDWAGGKARMAATLRARDRIHATGSLRGFISRGRVDLAAHLGPQQHDMTMMVRVASDHVAIEDQSIEVTHARALLPFGSGRARPRGWVRGNILYEQRSFGSGYATVQDQRDHHTVRGTVDVKGGARVAIAGTVRSLPRGLRGRFDLAMSPRRVAIGPLARAVLDIDVIGTGKLALTGGVDLRRGRSRGWLDTRWTDTTIGTSRDTYVTNGSGRFHVPVLFPTITAPLQQLSFERGRMGKLQVGAGSVWMSVVDDVVAARSRVLFAGGTLRTSRFIVTPRRREAPLMIHATSLNVHTLTRLAGAKVDGHGRLSGKLTVHIGPSDAPYVRVGVGTLRNHGEGNLEIRDPALVSRLVAEVSASQHQREDLRRLLRARIAGALADFDYSRLHLFLHEGKSGTLARAELAGRGRRVPQELSMAIRVRGLNAIVDQPLDFLRTLSIRTRRPQRPPLPRKTK